MKSKYLIMFIILFSNLLAKDVLIISSYYPNISTSEARIRGVKKALDGRFNIYNFYKKYTGIKSMISMKNIN